MKYVNRIYFPQQNYFKNIKIIFELIIHNAGTIWVKKLIEAKEKKKKS